MLDWTGLIQDFPDSFLKLVRIPVYYIMGFVNTLCKQDILNCT